MADKGPEIVKWKPRTKTVTVGIDNIANPVFDPFTSWFGSFGCGTKRISRKKKLLKSKNRSD